MLPEDAAYRSFQQHVYRLCFLIVATTCSDGEIDSGLNTAVDLIVVTFATPLDLNTVDLSLSDGFSPTL
jgi:hypothetical protein